MPRIRKLFAVLPAAAFALPLTAFASTGSGNVHANYRQFPEAGGNTLAKSARNGSVGSGHASGSLGGSHPSNGNALGAYPQFPEPGGNSLAEAGGNGSAYSSQASNGHAVTGSTGNSSEGSSQSGNGNPLEYHSQFPKQP